MNLRFVLHYRTICFLTVLCLLASLLASCSNPTGNSKEQAQAQIKTEEQQPVEIYFYSISGMKEDVFMDLFGNKIKEKFPFVTPKFYVYGANTKLDNLLSSKAPIDILFDSIGSIPLSLLEFQLQYDISDLIKKNKYDLTRLEPVSVETQKQIANGAIYGLPVFTSTPTIFYNKDLFDKFGVAYPKDGMTWDDLYDLTKKMARFEDNKQYWGLILSLLHVALLNQNSAPYVDSKSNKAMFASPAFKTVFETFTRFYTIPGNQVNTQTVKYSKQLELFEKDRVVAMYLGLNDLGATRFKNNFNWDVASYPVYKEKPTVGPQTYPSYFHITNISKHKDLDFSIIAYLTSDEFQKHLARKGMFPILKNKETMTEYGKEMDFIKNKHIKGFVPEQYAPPAETTKYKGMAYDNLNAEFEKVLLGQEDINTALRIAEEKTDKAIQDDLKAKK